ncbi:fasciclin domain-containing protein [Mariniflexile gromovii]|uniref:Fasciclin domain-containing protein n=1 Tax=Mariniflexile gromovii TaxID=362523 RepID=A0ABS4BTS2_9FLAO|nr:fasciclin domain-containing protein [Mariniflexile gromovii]MBP0903993.1 fasciclin domain-containing protein [Mariniflexile gromovii]
MTHRMGIIMLFIIISTFGCKPDPLEFARPNDLAGTIYSQLESMGNFNYYLQCIDKTEYKDPLVKGGSWTIFAPTDEAFEKFMQAEGYTSVDDIPSSRLLHIVQYSIITSGWNTTTLTYYPSQFYAGSAFKRRTQYQDTIATINTEDYNLYETANTPPPGVYRIDQSYGKIKPTTYFLQSYFDTKADFQTSDYAFMFPGETFTDNGMKVFEANVSETNIVAENGMIYALDKVIEPRNTQYKNLTSEEYGGKYTRFKQLLERFAYMDFRGNLPNEATGEIEPLYYLNFLTGVTNNYLPFNPYDESYPLLLNSVDRTLANATGLVVPTNDALEAYLQGDSILGQFYDSYDDMPLDVLGKFISTFFFTHFWTLCPSNQGETLNVGLQLVDYNINDVVDVKMCTNGLFVGIDKVYTNANFSTILGPLLLDPDYTIMLKAVKDLGIDVALQSRGSQFSVFGIKNDQYVNIADPNSDSRKISIVAYTADLSVIQIEVTGDPVAANNRRYPLDINSPTSADVAYVTNTLKDIVLNQIVEKAVDLSSNNYYATKSGEFIYVSEGTKVSGGGNINDPALVTSVRDTDNGKFYEMSRAIERPLKFTYGALVDNSATFSRFIEVMESTGGFVAIPNNNNDKLVSFLNLSRTFTLLAPNNNAVNQAISDGVIVEPSTVNSLPALEQAIAKQDLLNFAKKHFIQQAIPTDGITAGSYASMYFGKVIDFVPVYDEYLFENNHATSNLTIKKPATGEVITETGAVTNLLSRRVVIHEIENYLN